MNSSALSSKVPSPEDLDEGDVYVLDSFTTIWLWIGAQANAQESEAVAARAACRSCRLGRAFRSVNERRNRSARPPQVRRRAEARQGRIWHRVAGYRQEDQGGGGAQQGLAGREESAQRESCLEKFDEFSVVFLLPKKSEKTANHPVVPDGDAVAQVVLLTEGRPFG